MLRKTLIVLHRWVALVVGVVLLCTAVSGATLVFEGAIDRELNPGLWRVEPATGTLPLDTLVARVEAKFSKARVSAISTSGVSNRAWTVGAGPLTVFVDPHTGSIIGTRTPDESQHTLARRLHVFHVELFASTIGRTVVGLSTIVGLFLVLTGIVLWWPDKLYRVATGASWKRINFDLHHVLGITAAIVLIVITSSGLVIHYDGLTKAVRALDKTPPLPPPKQASGSPTTRRLSFDAVTATARAALPGAEVVFVSLGSDKNPATVAMRFSDDHTPGGRSRVFVDHFTGALLGVQSTHDAGLGTRIDNLKRSLHTGDVFGKPSEVVWLLATLVMASQAVTGTLMWINARRGRKRSA